MIGKLKILAVIFLVLLVAVIAKRTTAKSEVKEMSEQLGVKPALGEEFLVSKVTRIEIYSGARPDKKIVLALKDRVWVVESHGSALANREKIDNFLQTLKGLGGQLRITDKRNLKDFYLAQDPQASLFDWKDFESQNFHKLLGRLKSGGRYLFSMDGKYREDFRRGLIPESLRRSLKLKGYVLSKQAKVTDDRERWLVGKYFVQNGRRQLDVYLCDPMSDYLRRRLILIRELLKNYDANNYPAGFAMFILGAVSNERSPMSPYLQAHLQELNVMCKVDVKRYLEFYLKNPNGSKRARGAMGILDLLLKRAISEEFNKLLKKELIYGENLFSEQPPREILQAARRKPEGAELIRVNRLLLESIYPQEIVKSHRPIHVKVYSEKNPEQPSYHLLIGKKIQDKSNANAATGCFVCSREATGKVYEVGINLRGMLMAYGDKELVDGMTLFPWLAKIIELKPGELERIDRITLKYPDKKITLSRLDGKWQANSQKFPLRKNAIQYLINQLDSFEPMDVIEPRTKLDWQFSVEFAANDSVYEVFGSLPEPGGDGFCQRKGSSVVYKVWKGKFSEIFCKGANLFELPTLACDTSQLKRMKLITPQGEVTLDRWQGNWICPNLPLKVRESAVKNMLASFSPPLMDDFAGNRASSGLLKPYCRMILTMRDNSDFDIDLGAPSPVIKGRYCKFDGFVGVITKERMQKMFPKYRLLFVLEPINVDIDEFTLKGESGYNLRKEGKKWMLIAKNGPESADLSRANKLAKTFHPLVARDLSLPDSGEKLGKAAATVILHASAMHRIDFYRPHQEKGIPVKVDGGEIIYWLSPQTAQIILQNASQYCVQSGK